MQETFTGCNEIKRVNQLSVFGLLGYFGQRNKNKHHNTRKKCCDEFKKKRKSTNLIKESVKLNGRRPSKLGKKNSG